MNAMGTSGYANGTGQAKRDAAQIIFYSRFFAT